MSFLNFRPLYWIFALLTLMTSCIGYKKTLYFQGTQTEVARPVAETNYKLQAGDIIMVKLFTPDTKSAEMLDQQSGSNVAVSAAGIYMNNHSVSDSGFVDLPLAGSVYVLGYTVKQVDSIVTERAKNYFTNFTINVKLVSYKFMALGEFKHPGYTYVYSDKCTIFEAISLAGDATDLANKTKVTVVRQSPGQPDKIFKVNLTDFSVYESEAFNIQPNDVIYIQPQKAKTDSRNIQYITLGFAAISSILLVINYIGK